MESGFLQNAALSVYNVRIVYISRRLVIFLTHFVFFGFFFISYIVIDSFLNQTHLSEDLAIKIKTEICLVL